VVISISDIDCIVCIDKYGESIIANYGLVSESDWIWIPRCCWTKLWL